MRAAVRSVWEPGRKFDETYGRNIVECDSFRVMAGQIGFELENIKIW